mmetsp:Transcript_23846/g.52134  ORF Transcript_23846/g.52134 Transcript_23846/m.52134 type:complete len:183 (+) Transcript_23846:215-763(+)
MRSEHSALPARGGAHTQSAGPVEFGQHDAGAAAAVPGPRVAGTRVRRPRPDPAQAVPAAGKLATYEFARGSAAPLLGAEGVSSFGAQLACAFLAAIVSSVLSQPGDSLLSEVNRSNVAASIARRGAALGQGSGVLVLARRLGLRGLFRGTGARLVQMTLVVVLQLLIYDSVRQLCGLSPLGT